MILLIWAAYFSVGMSLAMYISAWALSAGSRKDDPDMKWLIPAIREIGYRFMLVGGVAATFALILRVAGVEQ